MFPGVYITNKIKIMNDGELTGLGLKFSNGKLVTEEFSRKTSSGIVLTEKDSDGYAMVVIMNKYDRKN